MCAPASDPVIWEILVHLLQDRGPGSDTVVRLTAASALRECVDVSNPLPVNEHRIESH